MVHLLSFRQLLDADLLHVVLLVEVVELDVSRQLQCTAVMTDLYCLADKRASSGVSLGNRCPIAHAFHTWILTLSP